MVCGVATKDAEDGPLKAVDSLFILVVGLGLCFFVLLVLNRGASYGDN